MTVSMMAEPVWCTHLLKFKCIFRAIQPFLSISVSFIQAELLNFISQKLHSQKRNDLFWSATKAEKPELPNTKRHKKLLLWHHERWRWKRLDMSCEAHDKRKKEKKRQGVSSLQREDERTEEPLLFYYGVKPPASAPSEPLFPGSPVDNLNHVSLPQLTFAQARLLIMRWGSSSLSSSSSSQLGEGAPSAP